MSGHHMRRAAAGNTAASGVTVEATNSSSEAVGTTSHTVSLPAGITAGDELIVIFGIKRGSITTPSGWTLLHNSGPAPQPEIAIYRKVASGSEGSTVSITTSLSEISNHYTFRLSGAGATEVGTVATGSSTAPDPTSLTPVGGALDYLWIAAQVNNGGSTTGYPTNYTNGAAVEAGGESYVAVARRELNASSENPGAFTLSVSQNWRAITLAVPPA